MDAEPPPTTELIEWAISARPVPGESESGDRAIVVPTSAGMLVAVVDGLGHGADAAEAGRVAVARIERYAEEPLESVVKLCHEGMKWTRGAVMSLASFHRRDNTLAWLGVGNVEGVLLQGKAPGTRRNIIMRGGVVGSHLPVLQAVIMPVFPGDTLVFATDGIRRGFDEALPLHLTPQQIADGICARHSKGDDDALVLVARYRGDTP